MSSKILVLLAAGLLAHAQEKFMSYNMELANGVIIECSTFLEPPLKNSELLNVNGSIMGEAGRIHRSIFDKAAKIVTGYDLVAESAGDGFLVRIEPLTPSFHRQSFTDQVIMLPKYPLPQTIRQGDIIALDILVSPDGKRKLVDYISVRRKGALIPAVATVAARDFTLDDGPLSIQFPFPNQVYVNGRTFGGQFGTTTKPGGTLWFDIPGQGRYILSLAPRNGFQKSGTIRDNTISLSTAAGLYEFVASGPILGAGKAWNLYVFHDPSFQPRVPDMISIGVDRLENLMPRR